MEQVDSHFQLDDFRAVSKLFGPGEKLGWHDHSYGCLCVLLRGEMVETTRDREQLFGTSDWIYKPPRVRHRNTFGDSGSRVLTIELSERHVSSLQDRGLIANGSFACRSSRVLTIALRIASELSCTAEDAASGLIVAGLSLELLGEVGRDYQRSTQSPPPQWIRDVEAEIRSHFLESPKLSGYARRAGVHPVYLAQAFRTWYGYSVGQYIRRLRTDYACKQILQTTRPLVEVGLEAGFRDQSQFSRAFKKETGLSPGEIRKRFGMSRENPESAHGPKAWYATS